MHPLLLLHSTPMLIPYPGYMQGMGPLASVAVCDLRGSYPAAVLPAAMTELGGRSGRCSCGAPIMAAAQPPPGVSLSTLLFGSSGR
jgi:hypothetical protein